MTNTDLKDLAASLRAAVDAGDFGAIANGVAILERSVHDDSCKITRLIRRGDDLGPIKTVGNLMDAGSNWLRRHVIDDPCVLFQVEGDDRWHEATALFVMEEADPEWVRDLLEDERREGAGAMKAMTLTLTAVRRDYYTFSTTVLVPDNTDPDDVDFKALSLCVDADDYDRDDHPLSGEWDHLGGELTPCHPGAVPSFQLMDEDTLEKLGQGG